MQRVYGCDDDFYLPILGEMRVSAATPPVKIKVTYGQTEARTMLADINEFRTSDTEAWCWDKTDSIKESWRTTELQYDYELERVAMKRAAEIALSYDHTRSNGTSYLTAYPSGYKMVEKILLPVIRVQQRCLTDGRKRMNLMADRDTEEICSVLILRLLESGMSYIRDAITGCRSLVIRSWMGRLQQRMTVRRLRM